MAETAPPQFWNIPNLLTLSRLVLGFVVYGLIAYEQFAAALVVFAVAALTDAADGYVARWLKQSTAIGRQLDPVIDKVVVAGAFVYLLTIDPRKTGLAPWMVTLIITRELLIQWLRSLLEGRGEAFGARSAGKLKTLFQCLSISAILLYLAMEPPAPWHLARDVITWVAVGLTLYSGLVYVVIALPLLRRDATAGTP